MDHHAANHRWIGILEPLVQNDFLKKRIEALGENPHSIAVKIAASRHAKDGVNHDPKKIRNTVAKAIENPSRSRIETIDEIIQALDGKLTVRWSTIELIEKESIIEEEL